MTDTELLELAAMAAEGQKGERGPSGVGIREINQSGPTSFTIVLEDGRTKEIQVPAPIKGEQGERGSTGSKGDPGPVGSAGRNGVDGAPGAPGTPGNDGSFVDTAIVNSAGELLLGLSTGLVINCGPVVGPAGEAGPRGVQGAPGTDGQDGAAVLSGPRPPQSDDGVDGDHWIDLSSTTYGFYKKASGTWTKLAELRTQQLGRNAQQGAAVGGAAGGGSGGAPSVPPVIIDLDPPTVNNDKKPLRAGDLWFDSDQLALYVATKDAGGQIVWVICIPGVTGVPGTQAASVPVVYPKAVDGEEWINPLTQVTYKFNEPKKQWINVNGGIVSVQDKRPATPQTGSLWYDTEADELTLYIYTGAEWVPAAPPVSLDGINATIDAALIVQNDLLDRVAAGETKQQQVETTIVDSLAVQSVIQGEQGVQNDQINALETQVQLLAGVRAVGRWTYRRRVESNSPRPPATAAFYGTHKADISTVLLNWSDINLLMINKTDIDGNTFTFSDFEEGDKVEVIATDGSSACYGTVTNNPSNDVYANMIVAVERSNSGPVEEKEYLISAYRPGSSNGEVDLDILDGRYLKRTGDQMNQGASLTLVSSALKLNKPNDEKMATFYKASDSFSQITAYNGYGFKVTARDGDPGGGRTYIDLKTADSSGTEGEEDGYRMKLFHVATPTNDFDGANKKYVDNAVSNSGGGGGTAGITLNLWTYKGSKSSSSGLNDGEFGSRMLAGDVLELYLAGKNSLGKVYHPTNTNNAIFEYSHQITNSGQAGSPLTVMHKDGRCMWYAETKKITFNKGNNSGVMIEAVQFRAGVNLLSEGQQYMLNVAGFLSPVMGWS